MEILIYLIMLLNSCLFIGTAENTHYIQNQNGQGYYIENDLGIHTGDKVAILHEDVYIIDCIHQQPEPETGDDIQNQIQDTSSTSPAERLDKLHQIEIHQNQIQGTAHQMPTGYRVEAAPDGDTERQGKGCTSSPTDAKQNQKGDRTKCTI